MGFREDIRYGWGLQCCRYDLGSVFRYGRLVLQANPH